MQVVLGQVFYLQKNVDDDRETLEGNFMVENGREIDNVVVVF